MGILIAAALAFAALHLLVSGTAVRGIVVGRIGERAYLAAFSAASAVLLGAMIWAYGQVRIAIPSVDGTLRGVLIAVNELAILLMVLGVTTPGPTLAGAEGLLRRRAGPRAIHHVTRHPFLWGMALWGAAHAIANPGTLHAVFFGSFVVVALVGTVSIDHKRARKHGEDWTTYAGQTSNLPFIAIMQGRTGWGGREWLDWRVALAVGVVALAQVLHGTLSGVPL